jgi:hypothetical protein
MFIMYVLIAGVVVAAAAAVMYLVFKFNLLLIAIAAVLVIFGVSPATFAIGTNVARDSASTYHEYYDGYETAARSESTTCYRDGPCYHTYECDVYYTDETYTDDDGKTKSKRVRHSHDCPYSTQETSYYVDSTIGTTTIASHLMTGRQYRAFTSIPGGRQSAPSFWTKAKQRIAANKPNPVTAVHNYQNYILASSNNLFKRYSDQIDSLVKKNLLPKPAAGVYDFYNADKAYFAGNLSALNKSSLTKSVASLGGAVGNKLQGDVHVVFVNASQVDEPTDYLNALLAYWQSPTLGRDAISKNAIIVVVGVGSYNQLPTTAPAPSSTANTGVVPTVPLPTTSATVNTVTTPQASINPSAPAALWVRAATGMPVGNEAMLTQIRNTLQGQVINSNFIGKPTYNIKTQQVVHTDGLLENVIFGVNHFQRISMTDNSKGDKGLGYRYLQDQITISTGAYVAIAIVNLLLAAALLLTAAFFSARLNTAGYGSVMNYVTFRRYR